MAAQERRVLRIGGIPQMDLFPSGGPPPSSAADRSPRSVLFDDPDPSLLYVGRQPLGLYLREAEMAHILALREFLRHMDWSALAGRYEPGGRPPYSPCGMVSLIVYGVLQGRRSLRELEHLARLDVGAMWLTGGLAPDHSSIGKFLNLHQETLTQSFFEDLTRAVLKITGGQVGDLSGDATVVQAAAARYGTISAEAARQASEEARARAEAKPHEQHMQEERKKAEAMAQVAAERSVAREKKGRDGGQVQICPTEPEAVVQPLKDKSFAPSYKPSVLANDQRIVVAYGLDPSSETKVLAPMVEQAQRVGESRVERLKLDAGYCSDAIIDLALAKDIDLLCPEGKAEAEDRWEKHSDVQIPKSAFIYDPATDTYRCPAGETLRPVERYQGNEQNRGYVAYTTSACGSCVLRERCAKGVQGRRVKRFEGDEKREALREVMRQPAAREAYRQRQAEVEPVFGELKNIQGLRRFLRRGLKSAKLEFVLHLIAHNLRRMLCLAEFAVLMPLILVLGTVVAFVLTESWAPFLRGAAVCRGRRPIPA